MARRNRFPKGFLKVLPISTLSLVMRSFDMQQKKSRLVIKGQNIGVSCDPCLTRVKRSSANHALHLPCRLWSWRRRGPNHHHRALCLPHQRLCFRTEKKAIQAAPGVGPHHNQISFVFFNSRLKLLVNISGERNRFSPKAFCPEGASVFFQSLFEFFPN